MVVLKFSMYNILELVFNLVDYMSWSTFAKKIKNSFYEKSWKCKCLEKEILLSRMYIRWDELLYAKRIVTMIQIKESQVNFTIFFCSFIEKKNNKSIKKNQVHILWQLMRKYWDAKGEDDEKLLKKKKHVRLYIFEFL